MIFLYIAPLWMDGIYYKGAFKRGRRLLVIDVHCLKSVKIRSYFWSVFSRIRTEYGEILEYAEKCGKIRTRNNSVFGHFSRSG